tara:strand:- start:157 stop:342 length:186 start_codon:yes stop_codon:yes gene_type:complete
MQVVKLTQAEYKTFVNKVAILKRNGITLDFSVTKPNHKKVKITMHKQYNYDELDRVCEACR